MWGRGEEGLFFRHNAPRRMVTPKVVWRSRRPYITRVVAIKPRVLSARGRGRRGGRGGGGRGEIESSLRQLFFHSFSSPLDTCDKYAYIHRDVSSAKARRMEISIHRPFVLQRRSVKNARTNRVTLGFSIIPSDSQPMNDSSINSTAHPNVSRVVLT